MYIKKKSWALCCLLMAIAVCCPAQGKHARPNILLCVIDDASLPHFGAYGSKWVRTPSFDNVAQNGILFRNAYTPNAKCSPSRSCILTGRNSWQLEELGNHSAYWPKQYISVFEVLRDNGYEVGFTGKGCEPIDPGMINGKPRELTGKGYQEFKLKPPTTGISKTDYVANFKQFLTNKPKDKPFCFWFGSWEAHREYEYGSGLKNGLDPKTINDIPLFLPDNDSVRNDLLDYANELEYFDKELGQMLASLKEKGLLNNTIVVVTSDNGMPFPRVKGQAYELSNHMPLAIMWKNGIKAPNRDVNGLVSFIDLAPTFLEIAGISRRASKMPVIQGTSLTDLFYNTRSGKIRDHVLIGKERHDVGRPHDQGYPIRGVIKGGLLFIKNFEPDRWPAGNPETGYLNCDGGPTKTIILNKNRQDPSNYPLWYLDFGRRPPEELYNIKADPYCMNNLINKPAFKKQITTLRGQLMKELTQQQDPRMFGKGYLFDKYKPIANDGFYEKFMQGVPQKTQWVNTTDFETDPKIIGKDVVLPKPAKKDQ